MKTTISSRYADIVVPVLALVGAVSLGAIVGASTTTLMLVSGAAVAGLCMMRPKFAVWAVMLTALLFREETWQLIYLGSTQSTATFYTINAAGITFQLLAVSAAFLRTILTIPTTRLRRLAAVDIWLFLLLGASLFAEVWGRAQSGYHALFIGHAQYFALPVMAALVIRAWFAEEDVLQLLKGVFFVAVARCAYGLTRFVLGFGDVHFELQKRIVFWDAADGLVAVGVVVTCVAVLLTAKTNARRIWAAVGVLLGVAVIALSLRRAAMIAGIAGLVVVLWTALSEPGRRARVLGGLIAAGSTILGVSSLVAPDSVALGRLFSVASVSGPLASTNMWHFADLLDGLDAVLAKPLLGWGYHVSPPRTVAFLQMQSASIETIGLYHNMYIYAWVRMGILGFAGVVALGLLGLTAARRIVVRGGNVGAAAAVAGMLAAIMVAGMSAHTLWSFRIPYFYFGLAACICTILEQRWPAQDAVSV